MRVKRQRRTHSEVQDPATKGAVTGCWVVSLADIDIRQRHQYNLHPQNRQVIYFLPLKVIESRVAVSMEEADHNSLRWTPLILTGGKHGETISRIWASRMI